MRKNEVMLRTTIRYCDSKEENRTPLGIDESIGNYPFERFERDARITVEALLPSEMHDLFGITVTSRVIRFENGSIGILFAVIVGTVGIMSRYAALFDSIELIKKHITALLNRLLIDRYGKNFSVSTEVVWPRLRDPYDYPHRHIRKRFGVIEEDLMPFSAQGHIDPKRDGFFWFLLISNIALLLVVAALVWGAVTKVYFPDAQPGNQPSQPLMQHSAGPIEHSTQQETETLFAVR